MTEHEGVLEIVVYTVKPSHLPDFARVLQTARQSLPADSGMISTRTYRSLKEANQFVDVVYWESLDASESVAKYMSEVDEMKSFLDSVERLIVLDHFEAYS